MTRIRSCVIKFSLFGALIFSLLVLIPHAFAQKSAYDYKTDLSDENLVGYLQLFNQVLEKIQSTYIDPEKVKSGPLIHAAVTGMLQSVDTSISSHFLDVDTRAYLDNNIERDIARFCQALETANLNGIKAGPAIRNAMDSMIASVGDRFLRTVAPVPYDEMRRKPNPKIGATAGIGIVIEKTDTASHAVRVVDALEGSPAFKAGLQPLDIIESVDGRAVTDMNIDEVASLLRGERGSAISLSLQRGQRNFTVDLIRSVVTYRSVVGDVIDKEAGIYCIRIKDFDFDVLKEIEPLLGKFKNLGMKALILDMRNNHGGLLDAVVDVASLFLERRKLVAETKSRVPILQRKYRVTRKSPKFLNFPIVILVNNGTASGAEILATALRDHGRASIAGSPTFGMGVVQSVYDDLILNYAIIIPSSRFYTPRDITIDRIGIQPDVDVPMPALPSDILETISQVRGRELVIAFAQGRKDFTEANVDELETILLDKNLVLPRAWIRYLLREQVHRNLGKNVPFDIDTDEQLQEVLRHARIRLK